jgi:hypothetical protein
MDDRQQNDYMFIEQLIENINSDMRETNINKLVHIINANFDLIKQVLFIINKRNAE